MPNQPKFQEKSAIFKIRHFESFRHIQEGHGGLKLYLDHRKMKNKVKLSYPKFGHGTPISDPTNILFPFPNSNDFGVAYEIRLISIFSKDIFQ